MFKFLKPHKKSEVEKWAEEEIRLACNIKNEYTIACYNSAMRAYKSLMKDGHSGASIGQAQDRQRAGFGQYAVID